VLSGFDRSDLIISVGYDLVEYAPARWNPDQSKRIIHLDTTPAEVDAAYRPEVWIGSSETPSVRPSRIGLCSRLAKGRLATFPTSQNPI
jgi:hypothetical protein